MMMLFLAGAMVAATPATLADRIDTARSGDVIRLAPGRYSRVEIKNRSFNPPLVIDAGDARLTLAILGSSGVTVRGGHFGPALGKGAEGYASLVRQSSRVEISNGKFTEAVRAMVIDRSTDIIVRNSAISAMRTDGINVAASQRVLLDGGSCSDFVPEPGAHPDCVQLWSRKELPITADVIVRNFVVTGDTQGITAFNHLKREDPGFDRITFANNKVNASYPQGIALYDARDSKVTGNVTRSLPESKYRVSINVVRCERCTQSGNDVGPKR